MSEEQPTGAVGRRRRRGPHPVLAGALAGLTLLLLCWPFLQVPRPTLPATFLHVFVTWSAAIALLWWVSRGIARRPNGERGERDG